MSLGHKSLTFCHNSASPRLLHLSVFFFLVLRSIYYFTPAVPFVKLLSSNKVFFDSFFFLFLILTDLAKLQDKVTSCLSDLVTASVVSTT